MSNLTIVVGAVLGAACWFHRFLRKKHIKRDLNDLATLVNLISHDLRGPLTGMRGYCEILKLQTAGPLRPAQRELISHLERHVDLQERLIDQLLDLARMERGTLSIRLQPASLAGLLEEEVQKYQVDADDRKIELALHMENAETWPSLLLDEGRIRNVLWNLIYSGLKCTPEGGRIAVKARAENGRIVIDVSDTGIGLSPETRDHIFDKFFQGRPGRSKGSQGLVVGLAVSREIILAHGGTIRAASPGLHQGKTVTITLPLLHPQADSSAPGSTAPRALAA